jgi:hypothetical protein
LQERADLVLAWNLFELGNEPPAPLEFDSMARLMLAAKAEIVRLRAEKAKLVEALSWYADLDNCEIMAYDAGDRARAALASHMSEEHHDIKTLRDKVEQAYGLLWRYQGTDKIVHYARHVLLSVLDKEGQSRGIALRRST